MSDSVVKLRIDSREYDANIKRAGDALTRYFQKVREGGGTLMHLDEGVLEAVKAMGELGTQAKNTKGGLRELTQATTDMTIAYRNLTDEEKASPLGKAMQQSIEQMTERAGEMRDAMGDVQLSIQNVASDTRTFDQIAGAANLTTSSFQTLQGVSKLLGIEMGDNVEVIAKLQAAMAVTNGLTQIQNALQKQSAVMQGVMAIKAGAAAIAQTTLAGATGAATVAQRAFNAVANANPYVLLASAIAAAVSALYLFTSNDHEAEQAQSDLNRELERTSQQLAAIDRETDFNVAIAEAAGKSWEEIHKLRLEAARTKLTLADMAFDALRASGKATKEQLTQAAEESRKAWDNVMKVLNEGTIHEVQVRSGKGKGGKGRSKGSTAEMTEEQMNNQQIDKLTNEYIKATDERRQAIEKEIATLQKRNEEIQKLKDMAQGKAFTAGELGEVTVTGSKMAKVNKDFRENGASEAGLSSYIGSLKSAISQEDLGSEVFNNLTSKLQDASMMQAVLQQALASGASAADLSGVAQEIKQKLLEGDIDESAWQEFLDKINELIQNSDLKLTFDVDTKSVTTAVKQQKKETAEMAKEWQAAGTAIQAVGSAMSQIQDPAAKVMGTIAQAIATIALGYAQATTQAASMGPWAWIAFAATGLATMVSTISAIHSATGYAEGGIVPHAANGYFVGGNSFSGDTTPILANAGELVLNKSSQNNLASMITEAESRGGGGNGLARVSGEQIWIALNAYTKRTGQGELVTWK